MPNEDTTVKSLLAGVKITDDSMLEVISMVRNDEDHMSNNFEAMSAHLLPYCTKSSRKSASGKYDGAIVSVAEVSE